MLPPVPPSGQAGVPVARYEAYRATAQYVSPDSEPIQFLTGLTVRTVLVPCTVILLGRWNWWPSRLSRVEAQPGGPDGPGGPGGTGGPGGPGREGTEQDAESAAPRAR